MQMFEWNQYVEAQSAKKIGERKEGDMFQHINLNTAVPKSILSIQPAPRRYPAINPTL